LGPTFTKSPQKNVQPFRVNCSDQSATPHTHTECPTKLSSRTHNPQAISSPIPSSSEKPVRLGAAYRTPGLDFSVSTTVRMLRSNISLYNEPISTFTLGRSIRYLSEKILSARSVCLLIKVPVTRLYALLPDRSFSSVRLSLEPGPRAFAYFAYSSVFCVYSL